MLCAWITKNTKINPRSCRTTETSVMMVPGPFWIQWYHLFLDYTLRNKTRPTIAFVVYLSWQDTHRYGHYTFLLSCRLYNLSMRKRTRRCACICNISTYSQPRCMYVIMQPIHSYTKYTLYGSSYRENEKRKAPHHIQTLQILACISPFLTLCHLIYAKKIAYPGYYHATCTRRSFFSLFIMTL